MPRRVNKDSCVNCGACEPTCPVDAISEQEGLRYINEDMCIDCGACEGVCPAGAIAAV